MAELVANRYGEALFEAGLDLNKLEEFKKDYSFFIDTLEREKDLETILSHPKISTREKKSMLKEIFHKNLSQEFLNFLYVLIDKGRESHILNIWEEFIQLYYKHENIEEVTAITAVEMDEESIEKLRDKLSSTMDKKIIIKNEIDESIIGGVILKTESKIIDGSLKGRLSEMDKMIKNVSL